ncbi:hypothetical protein [Paraburkholderia sp. J8-2]|uniref:hypothetical protein n=1 Tax=Paraburkholderia sp. J8-2 TaxID=2805440 RepID=UPI002AB5FA4D|nr:hypothetical protein [Paraburkholderia sp. J8-2]
MTTPYTADDTIIASAENFCVRELRAGREPVFSVLEVGLYATWRQRCLFDAAMLAYLSRDMAAEFRALTEKNVERFLSGNHIEHVCPSLAN